MKKQIFLKPVNSIMIVDFLCLLLTAVLETIIPYEIYHILHPVLGYIFAACVVCHVFLNWSWIKMNIFGKK